MKQGSIEDGKYVFFLERKITQENALSLEQDLRDLLKAHPDYEFILDARELEHISSKGLRVLLRLIHEDAKRLSIRNVSEKLYPILVTSGITELVHVEMLLKHVSTDNYQILGAGRSSTVYQIDAETIIKKYDERVPIEMIRKEISQARKALVSGIPTAIPFALVRADDSYGIIFERIVPGDTVGNTITEDMGRFDEVTKKFTELLKQIHHTRIEKKDNFPAEKDIWLSWIEGMTPYYSDAEIGLLQEMVGGIPERNTMVHCDFHENNVLVSGDDLILIDMTDIGYGHPIFDLAGGAFRAHASLIPGRDAHHGLSAENMQLFWDAVLRNYFDTQDQEMLSEISDMCLAFGLVRSALFPMKHIHISEELRQIHVDDARKNLFPRQDWALQQLGNLERFF